MLVAFALFPSHRLCSRRRVLPLVFAHCPTMAPCVGALHAVLSTLHCRRSLPPFTPILIAHNLSPSSAFAGTSSTRVSSKPLKHQLIALSTVVITIDRCYHSCHPPSFTVSHSPCHRHHCLCHSPCPPLSDRCCSPSPSHHHQLLPRLCRHYRHGIVATFATTPSLLYQHRHLVTVGIHLLSQGRLASVNAKG